MKQEAQRIAIAEACPHLFWVYRSTIESARSLRPARGRVFWLGEHPAEGDKECDPLNDLNAMHEAEKCLSDVQLGEYQDHLNKICFIPRNGISWEDHLAGVGWNHDERIYATAAQRAKAFLLTIGEWTDK